ncbi:hypothetical protein [Actinophytocola gossypii]|uniref:Sensor histidine kinase n=1 Tax=Actinophytocola gossypii TaxID=2812003 RepID=A0ABT2J7S7_9PSEU|nr:hypothetical protein [Actinophytocola gossypii]MCT2583902.1 hypothetical protein [Actinophytocola gossypii]
MLLAVLSVVFVACAAALLVAARRLRVRVRRASWLLTRATEAMAEARRASVTVGGSQLVEQLLRVVARDGEPDADAAG